MSEWRILLSVVIKDVLLLQLHRCLYISLISQFWNFSHMQVIPGAIKIHVGTEEPVPQCVVIVFPANAPKAIPETNARQVMLIRLYPLFTLEQTFQLRIFSLPDCTFWMIFVLHCLMLLGF